MKSGGEYESRWKPGVFRPFGAGAVVAMPVVGWVAEWVVVVCGDADGEGSDGCNVCFN